MFRNAYIVTLLARFGQNQRRNPDHSVFPGFKYASE